jgi:cytochrome P450
MLPLPGLFARPAFLARHRLHNAFRSYFHQGQHTASSAPEFITSTAVLRRKWNVPIDDFARESFAMFTAGLINSVPALLWLVYYVFSDDVLITETREEVAKVVVRDGDEAVLDFGGITGKCPLLYSAYQEVLRIQGLQPGARVALADVVLPFSPGDGSPDREYLIPKGTLVQMPAGVLHKDTSVWGADALSFDARRFMKDDSRSAQERLQKKAYFPFGGGKHLCPGRHFAFLEILGTMVVLLLQYELEGSNGGRLKVPETTYRIGAGVAKPKGWGTEALEGRVRKRAGWEDVRWTFVFGS